MVPGNPDGRWRGVGKRVHRRGADLHDCGDRPRRIIPIGNTVRAYARNQTVGHQEAGIGSEDGLVMGAPGDRERLVPCSYRAVRPDPEFRLVATSFFRRTPRT